jgi:hypothetical protein
MPLGVNAAPYWLRLTLGDPDCKIKRENGSHVSGCMPWIILTLARL